MFGFTIRRLGASLLLLFMVLTATFFLIHLAPGEPMRLFDDPRISPEDREQLRRVYGLDRPVIERYGVWLKAVVQGDWGTSFTHQRPVGEVLASRFPNTVLLVLTAVAVEHIMGLLAALVAIRHRNRRIDRWLTHLSMMLFSMPPFILGLLLVELFAVRWPLFPVQQMRCEGAQTWALWRQWLDIGHHLMLPLLSLALLRWGAVMRFTRNSLLEVMEQDFIRTARSKGLSERRVLWVHAMPNAIGPVIQRLGASVPRLLSGSVIIEVIFAWPGIGLVTFNSILQRDYPMILAATALSAFLVIVGNLLADLLHASLDPRVRRSYGT